MVPELQAAWPRPSLLAPSPSPMGGWNRDANSNLEESSPSVRGDGDHGISSYPAPEARDLIRLLRGASRGMLVVGELLRPEEAVLAAQIARALRGWPVAADVLSGLRVGASACSLPGVKPVLHRGVGQ